MQRPARAGLGRHPPPEGGGFERVEVQAVLGPPGQDVLGRLRPFVVEQERGFALVERATEMVPEIGERVRTGEQRLGPRP